jgi:integrase
MGATLMAARKRRFRSPHPGVVLKRRTLPSGATAWRARFTDPDSGRETYLTLDPLALPTHEAQRLWAIRKAKEIAKRAMDLEAGAPKRFDKPFADAIDEYKEHARKRLRARTVVVYSEGIGRFNAWAEREGIKSPAELTAPRLASFREHLVGLNRAASKRGGRRGERQETSAKRSAFTINCQIRATKTMLNAWRVAGLLPSLTRDGISDAMKALPVRREQAEYLVPVQLQRLIAAAVRHDAEKFAATRQEHAGLRPLGTTPRYEPIAQFTVFLLLTGCRRGEGLGLRWCDVDFDAVDQAGSAVGEIRLRASATKMKHARTIGLEVSPGLRVMLKALKLRAGARDNDFVFGTRAAYTHDLVESARARLIEDFGAPKFDWQMLRSTCATYLTNAPGIFGSATVFLSARQLGHSVAVAERHYPGVHRGMAREARTLEAAMQIESYVRDLGSQTIASNNSRPVDLLVALQRGVQ